MRESFLPYNQPDVGEEEIEAVAQAIRSRWLTRGPLSQKFEDELSEFVGGRPVVALASCTAGLHLALLASGIGPGDEVITTPLTFAASVNVIDHVGATPVLADIDPETGNVDPNAIEARISPRTRAIIPVHYAGHAVDMREINRIRDQYGLVVIEDAAHAIAGQYQGQRIGTMDNMTAFSFYATKNLTTGEGGALVVPDSELAQKVRVLSLHGMSHNAWNRYGQKGSWRYDVVAPGYKYNMTDLEAAMGRVQLKKLEGMQFRRTQLAERISRGLVGLPVTIPRPRPEVKHAWHLYPLRLQIERLSGDRDDVIEDLKGLNIGTSVHFIPIHYHSYFQKRYGWTKGDFPRAEEFYAREISLPLYPSMSDQDADDVVEALSNILQWRLRR